MPIDNGLMDEPVNIFFGIKLSRLFKFPNRINVTQDYYLL